MEEAIERSALWNRNPKRMHKVGTAWLIERPTLEVLHGVVPDELIGKPAEVVSPVYAGMKPRHHPTFVQVRVGTEELELPTDALRVPDSATAAFASTDGAPDELRVWRLIAHHQRKDEAVRWSEQEGRISVGWGDIGDLLQHRPANAQAITRLVKNQYKDLPNAHLGGPSLWNFFAEMREGDLVIVRGGAESYVVEVAGGYEWRTSAESFTPDYNHQRRVVPASDDVVDDLRDRVRLRPASRQSARWAVALYLADAPIGLRGSGAERLLEGTSFEIVATRIERNRKARSECIKHHGWTCMACRLDLQKKYGELGREFIHVHHLKPLGESEGERSVDPKVDLVPLCPNCHCMIHRRRVPLTIEELRSYLRT
ncbi:MAG: hypothetical protein K8S98_13495 [Planctomycetes bacterium]|nr:hypothetical protein [Planctomycetota bacterium]